MENGSVAGRAAMAALLEPAIYAEVRTGFGSHRIVAPTLPVDRAALPAEGVGCLLSDGRCGPVAGVVSMQLSK